MRRRAFMGGMASLGGLCAMPGRAFAAAASAAPDVDPAMLARLAGQMQGDLYLPGDPKYETLRHGFAAKVDLHPLAIVHAAAPEDIMAAVRLAGEQRLPLAVRGGGHSYAGHNSCDGGLVIDLSGLRRIARGVDRSSVHVGGGALSGAVERETARTGHATVLGQCPSVGVGGFLLAGGVGPLMSRYGLGCDNVMSADVILADGRAVTASRSAHPDLFWAIRGGGGNFGVVTSFTLKQHPLADVFAGYLEFRADDPVSLLHIVRDLATALPDAMTMIAVLSRSRKPRFGLSIQVCHVGDAMSGRAAIAEVIRSPALTANTVKVQPYIALEQLVPIEIPPVHWQNRGGFVPRLNDDAIAVLATAIAAGPGIYDELSFIHLHGAVTKVPLGDTAFPLRGDGFICGIVSAWAPATGAVPATAWVDATGRALAPFGAGTYVNLMDREDETSVRRAYAGNYSRLAAVKARYDPSNLFAINQNIRPASG